MYLINQDKYHVPTSDNVLAKSRIYLGDTNWEGIWEN